MFGAKRLIFFLFALTHFKLCTNQVLQFGSCSEVQPVNYFDLENFLGLWYEIERFPTWYEESTQCAYKRFQSCGRRIEIEYGFIKDNVQFILHVNSSYAPGDDAVFTFEKNNVDPVGIPLSVIATDYLNYAVIYGCKNNDELDIKYISAWILSREKTLTPDLLEETRKIVNSLPHVSIAYLEAVPQSESNCAFHWTAHVQAEDTKEKDADESR